MNTKTDPCNLSNEELETALQEASNHDCKTAIASRCEGCDVYYALSDEQKKREAQDGFDEFDADDES